MLKQKDIRTDEQLKADGFGPDDIKLFRRTAGRYFMMQVEIDEAREKEDWETLIELEAQAERIEFTLKYQGVNPKKIPADELKANLMNQAVDTSIRQNYAKVRNVATGLRAFCIYCMGGSAVEVKRCQAVQCTLWPFRTGKNPFFGKTLPPVQEIVLADDDDVAVEEETTNEEISDADSEA